VYQQKVVVHYEDGTSTDTTLTQWSMGQFGQYAQSKGWKVDMQEPGLLALVMLRYQAYCELHRDPTKPRAPFDKWDMTVSEVEPLSDPEEVDPTEAASGD
jgi:hypothetical protein